MILLIVQKAAQPNTKRIKSQTILANNSNKKPATRTHNTNIVIAIIIEKRDHTYDHSIHFAYVAYSI